MSLQTNEQVLAGPEEYTDDYEEDYFSPSRETPILKDIQLDNKIISSHAKNKFIFMKPIMLEDIVGIPLIDEQKQIVFKTVLIKGKEKKVPVIAKFKKLKYLAGFEKKEEDFPVLNWFNDAVTSSIIDKSESRYIRGIDDLGISLMMKLVRDPEKYQIIGFLERIYSQKMSIADTGKGIGGGAIEKAKTNISRSEQTAHLFRNDQNELDTYRQRQAQVNKGWLGFGVDVPIIGRV